MASYSDIKRTISGSLASGNKKRAQELADSSWGSLTNAQKSELTKMGVAPASQVGSIVSAARDILGSKTDRTYTPTTTGGMTGYAKTGAVGNVQSNAYMPAEKTYNPTQTAMPSGIGEMPTYNSEYMDQLNALARQLTSMNYDDWTKGSQYQALADRYGQNGRLSMQDVLGQVASRTGGLASSYATTAAQQQYNQYMAQLEEVARQMYSQERGDLMDSANLYRNLANDEYDRYRDRVSDYNAQLEAAQAAARRAYSGSTSNTGGDGGDSKSSADDAERFSSSTALRLAQENASTVAGQLAALEAMYESGNITKTQYAGLVYAVKNPGR